LAIKVDKLVKLSKGNKAFLVLILVRETDERINQSDLVVKMKKEFGVGRHTTETAIKVCEELGLLRLDTERVGLNPMPSIFHTVTKKGRAVARLALELSKKLEEADEDV
jgi:hypothetical protein